MSSKEPEGYAECYPGMSEMNDALDDSDDEVDYTKMDLVNSSFETSITLFNLMIYFREIKKVLSVDGTLIRQKNMLNTCRKRKLYLKLPFNMESKWQKAERPEEKLEREMKRQSWIKSGIR